MPPDPSCQVNERSDSINSSDYVPAVFHTSENDDADISYEGYEMLPQEFHEDHDEPQQVDLEDSDSEEKNLDSDETTPSNFDQSLHIELKELWNASDVNRLTVITMDSSKEEVIRNAMAGFQLPATSIPTWAKNIPEEEWKQTILNKINSSNKTSY